MAEGTIDSLEIEITASADKAIRQLERLGAAFNGIKTILNGIKMPHNIFGNISKSAEKTSKILKETQNITASTKNKYSASKPLKYINKGQSETISEAIKEAKPYNELDALKAGAKTAAAIFQKIRDVTKSISNHIRTAAHGVKNIASGIAGIGKSLIKSLYDRSIFNSILTDLKRVKESLSLVNLMVVYRVLRSTIKYITDALKEGSENAYWFSKKFGAATKYISESYDTFASTSAMMKNQVGAAWATLFANIEPIITKIVEMVSRAAEVVTMFFAKLGGKSTYLKAINYGKEWAETTEDGSKAAKEWRNQLMGFDEINRLEAPDDSDNNKDKNKTPDYGAMFEEVPVESAISDLADKIKDLWNAQDWKGLGELIGNTLNDLFPTKEQFAAWGSKLGSWINGAIQTAYYALKAIDFHDWGDRVAAGINAALEQIDFSIWGRLLVRKFTAALDFLFGLLGGLDWKLVGKSIGDYLRGALDEATEWLTSYNWGDMAKKLWSNILALIDGFNVPEFAKSLSNFIITAAESAADFLDGIDWSDVVNTLIGTLSTFFDNFQLDKVIASIGRLLNSIKTALVDAFTAFGEWLRNKDWKELGSNFNESLQKLLDGMLEIIHAIPWTDIGRAIGDFLGQIDWWEVLKKLADGLWTAFKGVIALLFDSEGGSIIRHLGEAILGIRMVFAGAKAAGVIVAAKKFAESIGKEVAKSLSGTATEVETAATATGNSLSKFGKVFASFGESVKSGISAAASWLTTGLSEFTVAGETLLTGAAATFATAGLAVGDALLVSYDVNTLKDAANTYNETQKAVNNSIETTLEGYRHLYATKGKEVADEYVKMVVGIDTTSMNLVESQAAIRETLESQYDDVPKNMWEGFKQGWQYYFGEGSHGGLVVLLEDAFKGAINGIKKLLGIHSPSTVFKEIGQNMVEGLLAGLKEKWKDIENFFTQTIPDLVKKAGSAWDELKQKTSDAWNDVKEAISKKAAEIKANASEKLGAVASTVKEKWEGVKEKTSSTWENIKSVVSEKWNAITSTSQNAASNLQNSMSGAFNNVQSTVANTTGQVSNEMNNNWSNIANIVVNSMMNMANQIQQIFNNLVQQVSAATTQIHNMANQARNDAASINMPTANNTYNPNVRWNAKGGIVDSTTLFGIGEAGAEAIIPLERNTEWIGRVAAEMNNQNSDRYEDSSEVVVSALYTICDRIIRAMPSEDGDIDMDSLARSITRIQRRQARAIG